MKYAMMFPSSSSVCHTETAQVRRRPSSHHSWTSVSGACAVVFFWPLSPIYQIRILQILFGAKLHTEISFFQPIGSTIFHSHQLVGHFRCTCVAFMRCALHCLRSRTWPVLLGLAPKHQRSRKTMGFSSTKNTTEIIVGAIIWPSVPYSSIMTVDRGKITIFSATKKASPQDTTQATSRRCDQTPDVIVTTGRISPPRTAEFPPTWGMQAWHRKSANSPTSKPLNSSLTLETN